MEVIIKILNYAIDYTFGYIVKAIFWLLDLILPNTYTLVITKFADMFYQGIKYTLWISLLGTVFGFILASLLSFVRVMKINKDDKKIIKIIKYISNGIVKIYVTVFRGTPMMVQAMIIYYGLRKFLAWSAIDASIVIVSINTGAYLTEVIKNGIESVDKGQMEAARSLGFSYFKSMILVVYPQAIKNSMAAIGNEFVINIKDTSVLNVIGCAEMYYVLNISASTNYRFMEQMIVGAIIYLILTLSTTKILSLIDKKLEAPAVDIKSCN